MANTSPNNPAKEYNEMIKKFTELRDKAQDMVLSEEDFDENLLEEIEILQTKMYNFNRKYICSPHYIIPDPDQECTKH